MTHKILAAGSVALMGAGSFLGASAAHALTAADCGDAPVGGGQNIGTDYCEVYFSNSGEYTWTTPTNASEMWALVVGAGGGAAGPTANDTGYAGGGGDVQFFDFSDLAPETDLTIQTGAGGESNFSTTDYAEDGEPSWIESGSDTWQADGGVGNDGYGHYWGYCLSDGNTGVYTGTGPSYFSGDLTAPEGTACDSGAPGLTPSEDANTPAIFSDVDWELGSGGGVYELGAVTYEFEGAGASVLHEYGTYNVDLEDFGHNGVVAIRWIPGDGLASTGVDANGIGMTAGALGLSGVALGVVTAIRRSRRAK